MMYIVTWWTSARMQEKKSGYQVACFFKEDLAKAKFDEVKALPESYGCDLTSTGGNKTEVCKGK